jgi:hypothetical protein
LGFLLTTDQRVPHISLVFRQIWGTLWSVVRTEFSNDEFSRRLSRNSSNLRHDTVEDGYMLPGGESAYA